MTLEAHDLAHEFPEYKAQIHELKLSDTHFARLFEEYHVVNKDIHRIEVGAEVTSDDYLEGLKKQRLELKDQLFGILTKNVA
jgi:uncharacterized protein